MRRLIAGVLGTASVAAVVGFAAATSTADNPAGIRLERLGIHVADTQVTAWRLPEPIALSSYGPEVAGGYAAFAIDYGPGVTKYPAGTHVRYGIVELETGRLRYFQSSFDGGATGVLIGGFGRFLRVEDTGGPCKAKGCLGWAIVDTDPRTLESNVIDRGEAGDGLLVPRPVAGSESFAWQRPLPDGSSEIVEWRPGGTPAVIGRAPGQGVLAFSSTGWLLATMWGGGSPLSVVTSGAKIISPALAGITAHAGALAWAVQVRPTPLDPPGTSDVFVGELRNGVLTGRKVARVADVYGLAWVGDSHVAVGTPHGLSLIDTADRAVIPLPGVPEAAARSDGRAAVFFVLGERGEPGIAAVRVP